MMQALARYIDALNENIGRFVAWASLFMVLVTSAVVILRYGFNWNSIALQEVSMYLHAVLFMAAMAYTFKHDAHVRVDIFYANFSPRKKAWVNFIGSLVLLMPLAFFIAAISFNYVVNSWAQWEGSPETGGLPLVFLLKTLIPLMSALLFLQGLSVAMTSWLLIRRGDV